MINLLKNPQIIRNLFSSLPYLSSCIFVSLEFRAEYSKLILTVDYDFVSDKPKINDENTSRVIYELIGIQNLNFEKQSCSIEPCIMNIVKTGSDEVLSLSLLSSSEQSPILSLQCLEINIESWNAYTRVNT
jgi:hypothetical protein